MNNLILLSIVSFINDTASKIILPVLPLYISQLGGTGLVVGLVSGLGDSVASILQAFSGYWSDKTNKKKPFVFWGYSLSAVSKILLYFATTWPLVLLFRTTERAGKGIRSAPRDAMLAETTVTKQSGRTFGIHRAFDSGGAVLGSLLVLLILWWSHLDIRLVFLIAGIIAVFATIPVLFTKETTKPATQASKQLKFSFRSLSPELKAFIAIAALFEFGNFSWMFFVLYSESAFGTQEKILFPVILYAVYNISFTILAYPSGILADKIGKTKVLLIGYALFGFVTLGFTFLHSPVSFIVLFLLYGIMFAFVESNQRAFVSDVAPKNLRATALGVFFTMTSLAELPSGLLAGYLYDIKPAYTFIFGLITSVITVVLFSYQLHKFKAANQNMESSTTSTDQYNDV